MKDLTQPAKRTTGAGINERKDNSPSSHAFWKTSEHGQELVEFILVLPILILVFFGALDLGRLFHAGVVMTNAAREGARYAISHYDKDGASLSANTKAAAQAEAASSGIFLDTGDITMQCGTTSCEAGDVVRVTVDYDFELVMSFLFPDRTIHLRRFVEMMAI